MKRDFPPHWANLGRALLARGREGAGIFLQRLEELEKDCPEAISDTVRSVRASCLTLVGKSDQASALRMERINSGSHNPAFYSDEAKARLEAGDAAGALQILDLAEQRGAADEYTASMRASALRAQGTK